MCGVALPALTAAEPCAIDWLLEGTLQRLVLVVASVAGGEVLERWVFNVAADGAEAAPAGYDRAASGAASLPHAAPHREAGGAVPPPPPPKSEKEISAEIAAIVRQVRAERGFRRSAPTPPQITASVTFLPLLDEPCAGRCRTSPASLSRPAQAPSTCLCTRMLPRRHRLNGAPARRL